MSVEGKKKRTLELKYFNSKLFLMFPTFCANQLCINRITSLQKNCEQDKTVFSN